MNYRLMNPSLLNAWFHLPSDASNMLGRPNGFAEGARLSVASRFFEVRLRLQMEQMVVEERALVQRDGIEVVVLLRDRG